MHMVSVKQQIDVESPGPPTGCSTSAELLFHRKSKFQQARCSKQCLHLKDSVKIWWLIFRSADRFGLVNRGSAKDAKLLVGMQCMSCTLEMRHAVAKIGSQPKKCCNRFVFAIHRKVFKHRHSRRVNLTASSGDICPNKKTAGISPDRYFYTLHVDLQDGDIRIL